MLIEHIETSLTANELEMLQKQERTLFFPSIIVIGRAGAGKDTIGDWLSLHYGYQTDAMASTLKEIARVVFGVQHKDRALLQGLSSARKLLSSCYLDNTWRRILHRRQIAESGSARVNGSTLENHYSGAEPHVEEFTFNDSEDVLHWIKDELYPETPDVEVEDIAGMLAGVADERYGDPNWERHFQPTTLQRKLIPAQHVVLTDIRYPNELLLGLKIGAKAIWVQAHEEIRIERMRIRDGSVDPTRLNHPSETALDDLLASGMYDQQIIRVDNNGTYDDLYEQLETVMTKTPTGLTLEVS